MAQPGEVCCAHPGALAIARLVLRYARRRRQGGASEEGSSAPQQPADEVVASILEVRFEAVERVQHHVPGMFNLHVCWLAQISVFALVMYYCDENAAVLLCCCSEFECCRVIYAARFSDMSHHTIPEPIWYSYYF